MKSTPILFSAPMVRAIRDGRKTQTRRIIKPQPLADFWRPYHYPDGRWNWVVDTTGMGSGGPFRCPYGQPGDQLWGRETFRIFDSSVECACYDDCLCSRDHGKPVYRADRDDSEVKWKPSIFMPRWASRITLEVTGVRVEWLQDISEADAIAEGAQKEEEPAQWDSHDYNARHGYTPESSHIYGYRSLWESINGPGSWDANPWVWVVEFKRIEQ